MMRQTVTWNLPLGFRVVLKELVAVLVLLANFLFSVSMSSGGLSVDFYLVHMMFFPRPRLPRSSLNGAGSGAAAMAWLAHPIVKISHFASRWWIALGTHT